MILQSLLILIFLKSMKNYRIFHFVLYLILIFLKEEMPRSPSVKQFKKGSKSILHSQKNSVDLTDGILKQRDISKIECLFSERVSKKALKSKINKQNVQINSKTFAQIKAASVLLNLPQLHSPQLTIEVSEILREKLCNLPSEILQNISIPLEKTKSMLPSINNNSSLHKNSQSSNYNPKSKNPISLHRQKIIELQEWLRKKMQNPPVNVEESMQYRDIIMGIGMTHIIQIINSRCREEGEMVSAVWEITWAICREIMIYLSKRLRKCENILQEQLQFYRTTYDNKLIKLQQEVNILKKYNSQLEDHRNKLSQHLSKIKKTNKNLRLKVLTTQQMNKQLKQNFEDVLKQNLLLHIKQQPANQQKKKWVKRAYHSFIICGQNDLVIGDKKVKKSKFKDYARQVIYTEVSQDKDDVYYEPSQYQLVTNINSIKQQVANRKSQIDRQLEEMHRTFNIETQTQELVVFDAQINTDQLQIIDNEQQTDQKQYSEYQMNTLITYPCQKVIKTQNEKKNTKKLKTTKDMSKKKSNQSSTNKKALSKTDKVVTYNNNLSQSEKNYDLEQKEELQNNIQAKDDKAKNSLKNNNASVIAIQNVSQVNDQQQNKAYKARKQDNQIVKNQLSRKQSSVQSQKKNVNFEKIVDIPQVKKQCHPSIYQNIKQDEENDIQNGLSSKQSSHKILHCEGIKINKKISEENSCKELGNEQIQQQIHQQQQNQKQKQDNEEELLMLLHAKQEKIAQLEKKIEQLKKKQNLKGKKRISQVSKQNQEKDQANQNNEENRKTQINKAPKNWKYIQKLNKNQYSSNKIIQQLSNINPNDLQYIQKMNQRASMPLDKFSRHNLGSFKILSGQQQNNALTSIQSRRSQNQFSHQEYCHSCLTYLNSQVEVHREVMLQKMPIKQSNINTGQILEHYKDILKQIYANHKIIVNSSPKTVQFSLKHSQSCLEKNLLPIIRQLFKQIQNAHKNSRLLEVKQQYQCLPVIISIRFNRMYGVKTVANKHLKDLLSSLIKVQKISQKYEILSFFMIESINQNQANKQDLLFVYILIQLSIDPQFSDKKMLNQDEYEIIFNLCGTYLSPDPIFITKIRQIKENLKQINDYTFFSFYKGIMNSYQQFYTQRLRSIDFIYRMLTWKSNLHWNIFTQFLSAYNKSPEWHNTIIKKMAKILIEEKNCDKIISYQTFIKFLLQCPQFSIQQLSAQFDENDQNQQNQSLNQQILIQLSRIDNFMEIITQFVFQTSILDENENIFIIKYCKQYTVEKQVRKMAGILNNGIFDERVRGLLMQQANYAS